MKLWIVGKVINFESNAWEFQGVFMTEERAVAACRDKDYFVGPAILDKELPDKPVPWPYGAWYPLAR